MVAVNLDFPRKFLPLVQTNKRYKVFYGGRGAGKSWAIAIALLSLGVQKPIRVLCARELQISIADSVHKLLSDIINGDKALSGFYEVQNKSIIGANGTEFNFKGLKHNANEIKSYEGVDFVWVEEAQAVSDKSWEILIPTVRKEGSEIWISFNPKNPTDPTWQRFVQNQSEDTLAIEVNYFDNPFFPKVLEDERRKLLAADKETHDHIWLGKFDTRYSGAIYADKVADLQKLGRINPRVIHDPNYPVYTSWDLGYGDTNSIIFYQKGEGELFIIDYYEDNQEDIKFYCEVLYGKEIIVDERDLKTGDVLSWRFGDTIEEHKHRQGYQYHADFTPADSKSKHLAAGGRSVVAQLQKFGRQVFWLGETTHKDRHEALRLTLPKCWINSDRCKDLIAGLMHYHYEWDEDLKRYDKDPVHDWSSHPSTAAELMARVWREKAVTQKQLESHRLHAKFKSQRSEYGIDKEDPYRMRTK